MTQQIQYHTLSEAIVTRYFKKVNLALGVRSKGNENTFWDPDSDLARQHSRAEALLRSLVLAKLFKKNAREMAAGDEELGAVGTLAVSLKRNLILATNDYLKTRHQSQGDMSTSAKIIVDTIDQELDRAVSQIEK